MPVSKRVFHFSCGDSSRGPVGFCANIIAEDERAAVRRLRSMLPEEHSVDISGFDPHPHEYVNIYFGQVGTKHIDDEYDLPGADNA
jgi:hypothetical protein